MAPSKSIQASLSLIENDITKILGLHVGSHQNVQPLRRLVAHLIDTSSSCTSSRWILMPQNMHLLMASY